MQRVRLSLPKVLWLLELVLVLVLVMVLRWRLALLMVLLVWCASVPP
jgi:hypothetical protein